MTNMFIKCAAFLFISPLSLVRITLFCSFAIRTNLPSEILLKYSVSYPSILSLFASVPRIYEKVYSRIISQAEAGSPLKQRIFNWSQKVGREVSRHLQQGKPILLVLGLQFSLARKLVYDKIRAVFGGKVKFVGSSGAPIASEILSGMTL